MYPVLLGSGIWALPSYFTMVTIGFIVGAILLQKEAVRVGWNPAKIIDLSFYIIIASIAGARIAHLLFDGFLTDYFYLCFDPDKLAMLLPDGSACTSSDQCIAAQNNGYNIGNQCINGNCIPQRDCLRPWMFWAGGLTYYGGFLLAVATVFFFCRRWKWSFLKFSDIISPMVALGVAFGRLWCFLAGCCFGKVTDVPWAIQFPKYSDAWRHHRELYPDALAEQTKQLGEAMSLPVHPTQLYELFGCLAIFAFLWLIRKKIKFRGESLALLLILYGVLRFIIEIFRDDDRGGILLSTSQWISIPLIILGIVLFVTGKKRPVHDNPPQDAPEQQEKKSESTDEKESESSEKDDIEKS